MILVVGSINMDVSLRVDKLPLPGETVLAKDVAKSPGGKGANQAVAAAKVGADVHMLGCVGLDENGEVLLRSLEAAGVKTEHIQRLEAHPSSTAYICVSAAGENSIVVDSAANMELTPELVYQNRALFETAKYCILQMEIPPETVKAALELCREYNVASVLNPSPVAGLTAEDVSGVTYLIPNETEASVLLGKPHEEASEEDWQAFLKKTGIAHMIVTLGSQGCCYLEKGSPIRFFETTKRNAVDTTGAGDTFLGAFVASIAEGKDIPEAIRFASVASGIEVTRYGAQSAMPTREEVEREL